MKGIYKIINLTNNKSYIGQTDNLTRRERQHFYDLKRNKHRNEHLQKSYNKYGKDNFIFQVIEYTENLGERELYWINENGGINWTQK
jgi:group I intron endonuclease